MEVAVARREEELRVLVMKREEEVAIAIAKREEEIMEAVRNRDAEVDADAACVQREELIKKEVDVRIQWVLTRENELKAEEIGLEEAKGELEESTTKVQQQNVGRKEKSPLEEVKNLLEPTTRTAQVTPVQQQRRRKLDPQPAPQPIPSTCHHFDGNPHFSPHSTGLCALRDEGCCFHLNKRNTCRTLTRRTR